MKTKMSNPLLYGVLFVLFLAVIFGAACCNNKPLYPGQNIYTQTDLAHKYVREHIVNPSSYAVESRYFVDVGLYESKESRDKKEKPSQHVRKFLFGANGVATVIPQGKGYLITAGHVIKTAEAEEMVAKIVANTEKANPGMFLDAKVIAEYGVVAVNGKSFSASSIATEEGIDLGIIQVKNIKSFDGKGVALSKETNWADKSVFIIGNPLDIKNVILDARISNGLIEHREELGDIMYVVVPIAPGNSGGAVISVYDLKMAGVVSAVVTNKDPPSLTSHGIFIPNTVIEKFLEKHLPK